MSALNVCSHKYLAHSLKRLKCYGTSSKWIKRSQQFTFSTNSNFHLIESNYVSSKASPFPVGSSSACRNIFHGRKNVELAGRKLCIPSENFLISDGVLHGHLGALRSCHTSSREGSVTLETLLSGSNKLRVQKNLLSVTPARSMETISIPRNSKLSAVLVPLCTVHGRPSVLFTLRSSNLRKHRGEISFPGGFQEDSDPDIVHTALRETQEELGIDPTTVDVWGELQSVPSRDGSVMVKPILANLGEVDVSSLKLSEAEVALVFTRTVKSLCDPKNTASTQFRSGRGFTLPVFLGGMHRIWGLTAIVLHQTLTLVAPGLYQFKVRHRS